MRSAKNGCQNAIVVIYTDNSNCILHIYKKILLFIIVTMLIRLLYGGFLIKEMFFLFALCILAKYEIISLCKQLMKVH